MSEDRRLDVLRAIVSEYVHTREPVGSKAIAASHALGVSSATIRNDMAVLEEAGLIYQPHTSAGRVPTDKGYRLFVDRLTTIKPMSAPERRAVESFLSQGLDLDDVVARTVRLLAQVTRQVAVVEYPQLSAATLRRVELVDLGSYRVLVVVITSAGRVEERMIELAHSLDVDGLARLRARINEECEGLRVDQMRAALDAVIDEGGTGAGTAEPVGAEGTGGTSAQAELTQAVADTVLDLFRPDAESRIIISGMSNLARSGVDFRDISPVLDALEEQVALLRLFSELTPDEKLHVTIGKENRHDGLAEASVVTGVYGSGDGALAHLGVVGPTRMDYARTMSSVRAVAAYLSRYLTR